MKSNFITVGKLSDVLNSYNDSLNAYRDNPNDETKTALENAKKAVYENISNRDYNRYIGGNKWYTT